ncbi:MAG: tetratricopeptide repeat protein [Lentisphaeria bacterium]|nr:tetratricopeptide repeat protein [Lentisphaeria bacterium]
MPAESRSRQEDGRPGAGGSPGRIGRRRRWLAAVVVCLLSMAPYGGVTRLGFVDYDDTRTVSENPSARSGLSRAGLVWAFTSIENSNWFPVTRLSHLLDVSLYGMRPAGHHVTSVLIHGLASGLLVLLLARYGFPTQAALFGGLIFGVHPLHVESVAWISERKDVLCALFVLLTLLSYDRWRRGGPRAWLHAAILCHLLALMSKPMAVTVPCVLLLLEVWPYGNGWQEVLSWRAGDGSRKPVRAVRALAALSPLIALSLASALLTLAVQEAGGAVKHGELFPVLRRLANAAVSYGFYVGKTILPVRLAVGYPFPTGGVPAVPAALCGILVLAVSALAVALSRRRRGWLLTGWFWFVGMLVPVLGLPQIGWQARADRYMYLPMIGLLILAGGAAGACRSRVSRFPRWVGPCAAAVVVCALAALCSAQVRVWQDSMSLFTHAVRVRPDSHIAHANLGAVLQTRGDLDAALVHYEQALRVCPFLSGVWANAGLAREAKGDLAQAETAFREAVAIEADHPEATVGLLRVLSRQERPREVAAMGKDVGPLLFLHPEVGFLVGTALLRLGQKRAECWLQIHVADRPEHVAALSNLGLAQLNNGKAAEAVQALRSAVDVDPCDIDVRSNLGRALAALGDAHAAEEEFRRGAELCGASRRKAELLANAGAMAWEEGVRDRARSLWEQAIELLQRFPDRDLEHALRERLRQ